ncbi:MAG: adenylate/guanylate cyclase domain-containing protein [Pseudomonadales bacterium]|jgi:class 3 adenylate cyclase|nr:adenylate/guanylate cyclase domain-containing protein [Pseudomonadales bacterium]
MASEPTLPVHPLRATVFVPRLLAYLLAGLLLHHEAPPGGSAILLLAWSALVPWALRWPVPLRWHPLLRGVENVGLALLALVAGVPLFVLAAALLPFQIGLLSLHGVRAGLACLVQWVFLVAPCAVLLSPPLRGSEESLVLAGALVAAFALLVAALSNLQSRRLEAVRAELAERAEHEAALAARLARYLPPPVHRAAFASLDATNRSRRRWLTVCFADLAGFTALTDAAESEEVVAMLDDFYGAMAAAAEAYGGTLDKFIGDAVMVFFGDETGEPRRGRDRHGDARAAVEMALDMQRRLDALRLRWRDAGVVRALDLRVGLHSGWCTVGDFGPPERRAYTVIGATVNTASRLEAAAAPGEVLVSRATWLLLGDLAGRCRRIGTIRAKGLRAPVEVFQVLRDAPDAALELAVDGLALRLEPGTVDPAEARAALERALGALPTEGEAPRAGAG